MGTKLTLVAVPPPEPPEPPATREEATEIGQAAWKEARLLHLRLAQAVNSASMLRLHNGGGLPSEKERSRSISIYTLSGLAREMREIADLASQAGDILMDAHDRLRRY